MVNVSWISGRVLWFVCSLAMTTTTTAFAIKVMGGYRLLVDYKPLSQVGDQARIDLDLRAMQEVLADQRLYDAQKIYEIGGHSKCYADLSIPHGLPENVPEGTLLEGVTRDTRERVLGKAMMNTPAKSTHIWFQYDVSIRRNSPSCFVGGLPEDQQDTAGCLLDTEHLKIENQESVLYIYNFLHGNRNSRSLASFSTTIKSLMHDCRNCPYDIYQKYFQYYGEYDYANQMITAAFDKQSTSFKMGNANFSSYDEAGQAEFIQKAVVLLNVWMYVIRQMEYAVDECSAGDGTSAVIAWDEAVAYYVGSTESGSDRVGHGVLLYSLADHLCVLFGTCGETTSRTSGTSSVNIRIMRAFKAGQNDLDYSVCLAAKDRKQEISTLMVVPLIQGTLQHAYNRHFQYSENDFEQDSQGAAFASSILPLVHACNTDDAKIIYENMRVGQTKVDFIKVKEALERNYQCMGVQCEDIGILNNQDQSTPSCWIEKKKTNNDKRSIVTSVVGAIVLVLIVMLGGFVILKLKKEKMDPTKDVDESAYFVPAMKYRVPVPASSDFILDDYPTDIYENVVI